jgi:hypothetical protein
MSLSDYSFGKKNGKRTCASALVSCSATAERWGTVAYDGVPFPYIWHRHQERKFAAGGAAASPWRASGSGLGPLGLGVRNWQWAKKKRNWRKEAAELLG